MSKAKVSPETREQLIAAVKEWGYFEGQTPQMRPLMEGRRVLEIGMGGGPYSIAAIEAAGAASYVGVDPKVGTDSVLDLRALTDSSIPKYHAFPFSPSEIMAIYPNIKLYSDVLENVKEQVKGHKVDMAYMSSVTEHLEHLPEVFETIWETLQPGGRLWISHHGYHSWTGHHSLPRSVESWNRKDPAHNEVVDWKHLEPNHRSYSDPNYNRVRMDDFRKLIDKYFEIYAWDYTLDATERLTPEIRKRWKKYSLQELLGRTVRILAVRRDEPLDTDLSGIPFHHPPEDYLAKVDRSGDKLDPNEQGAVYFFERDRIASHSTNDFAALKLFERLKPGDRISLRKHYDQRKFSVAEVNYPSEGAASVRLAEPLSEKEFEASRTDWIIESI